MAKPRSDANIWTLKLLENLEDGEWKDYQEVIYTVAPTVPPGLAWRTAEYFRERAAIRQGRNPGPRKYGDKNDSIKTGQRYVVGLSIKGLVRSGRIELEYEQAGPKRRKPVKIRRVK